MKTLATTLAAALTTAALFAAAPAQAVSQQTIWLRPAGLVTAGAEAIENGQTDRGIELTEQAMKRHLSKRNRATALNNLCAGYTAKRDVERALSACNDAIGTSDTDWRAFNNRGNVHLTRGAYDEAITDYRRAIKLDPNAGVILHNLDLALAAKQGR